VSYRASTSPTGTAKVRRKTALSLDPLSVDVDEGTTTTFSGKLTEASGPNQGKGVAGKTIHFFVDGTDTGETGTTDSNGNFSLNHVWTTPGDFTYDVRYLGD